MNTALNTIVFILSIYSQKNTRDQNTYFYEHQMAASNKNANDEIISQLSMSLFFMDKQEVTL